MKVTSYKSRFHKDLTLRKVTPSSPSQTRNQACSRWWFLTEKEAIQYGKQCESERDTTVKSMSKLVFG